MSENKFIKKLKGEPTTGSLVEIKNASTPTSFGNMPHGTSDPIVKYSDHRGNATVVAKGTDNWKLNDNTLTLATTVYGDGRDFTDEYSVGGAGLWVNAVYTFTDSKIFMPNTKWVLKLCGNRLFTESHEPIALTLLIKFGTSTLISKTFFVRENSFNFSEELVIDFDESVSTPIKVVVGDTMTIQVLCGDATAQAEIYNGMTVLTALQRKVDGEAIASDTRTFGDIENELEDIHDDIDDLKDYTDETFVRLDGNSIMTGPLKMRASISFECAIAPYWHGVGFYKLNDDNSVTLLASMEADDGFCPYGSNKYNIGSNYHKWKNLYLAGKAFVATINNGGDLAVPANTTGTLATKADVDLAANSGRMITNQGVWYAKMYAGTTPPASAEVEGRNYADFSQVDGNNNPIIVIYTYTNGAWDSGTTIVPPADYDGYVPITSKIWDITEQAGQQGGRVLWNHQSKDFTPYPLIISFDGQNITNSTFSYGTITNSTFSGEATLSGNSTVTMPATPTDDNITNKKYVDDAIAANPQANTNLSNLTSTGQNIGNWASNVTNCITNIPQDIIAEFDVSTKTLTIKAGSKLYIPNGFEADGTTPHFDTITFATDQTLTNSFNNAYNNILVCWDSANNMFRQSPTHDSGSTDHYTTSSNRFWYDTDTNKIKYYAANNTTVTSDSVSLPVCRMESIGSGNGFKRILNVFNGFGYIGCSTFVLPGVKGLAPNGRNADGTYKNTEITFSSVKLHTIGYASSSRLCFLSSDWLFSYGVYKYFESDTLPEISGTYATWYDTLHNLVFDTADGGATWTQSARIYMGALYKVANNVITNINVKDEFKAVDYSDKHAITDLLMPDYTAGIEVQNATATSGSYTAPSNGQFVLDILAGTNTTTFKINNIAVAQQKATTGGAYNATYNVFVKYGDSITWTASGSGTMKAYFYPMTRI